MATSEVLTHEACVLARAKPKPYRLRDGDYLYLRIEPSGRKVWRWDYTFGGRRTMMAFGTFPAVSVQDARRFRDEAKDQIAQGQKPTVARKLAKQMAELAQRQTFGLVAEELLAKMEREGRAETTLAKNRWLMTDLASDLTHRPIKHLTPVEVLDVLRKAECRGRLESARRLRSAIGQVLRYGVATGRAHADFTPSLQGAIAVPRVKHRPAIIHPDGVGRLMLAIEGYEGAVVRHALTLMAYCFPRPGELRLAQWPEVDLRQGVWTIPAERAKMRREHRIPLAPQALKEFQALWKITGRGRDESDDKPHYCFPSSRPGRPMSEATMNAALRTLGYDGDTHVAHGFRATASSLINEYSDFSPDAIEKALGHVDSNAVRRAYHRAEHWDERVRLMDWWADFADTQRNNAWKARILA